MRWISRGTSTSRPAESVKIHVSPAGSSAGVENNGGEGKSNEDKTYDESEAKRNADEARTSDKTDSKKTSDSSADDSAESSEGGMKPWIIVLIVVAGVIVLISVEVFVFEMVKLNKSSKK